MSKTRCDTIVLADRERADDQARCAVERKRDRRVCEFKVTDPAGRLCEVHVDAATAAILKREGD